MSNARRYALAVAHPSHELRMYGWLEREQPAVYVLTDGGGRSNQPRLPKTAEVVDRVGAQRGAIFGQISDLAVYDAILARDTSCFAKLAEDLAEDLIAKEIDCIVGDAAEGYSSAHDAWRLTIDAAVRTARAKGHEIENCEFFVIAPPDERPADAEAYDVTLDDDAFTRKMNAARAYSPKLAGDIDSAMAGGMFYGIRRFSEPQVAGDANAALTAQLVARFTADERFRDSVSQLMRGVPIDAFRHEFFWPRDANAPLYARTPPFFEAYGEALVKLGRYEYVIRYEEHLRPIADALMAAR